MKGNLGTVEGVMPKVAAAAFFLAAFVTLGFAGWETYRIKGATVECQLAGYARAGRDLPWNPIFCVGRFPEPRAPLSDVEPLRPAAGGEEGEGR